MTDPTADVRQIVEANEAQHRKFVASVERLKGHADPDVQELAEWVDAKLRPNGDPIPAVVRDGVLVCSDCGNDTFAYEENCVDYRRPGGQDPVAHTVTVKWAIDGTGESGDSNPGLICDTYGIDSNGCGRPITLPSDWEIDHA